jgi:hypothetical protein
MTEISFCGSLKFSPLRCSTSSEAHLDGNFTAFFLDRKDFCINPRVLKKSVICSDSYIAMGTSECL